MIYRDLVQLSLCQREGVNACIYRAVTAITVGPVTDKQILDFDLVNYILPSINCKMLLLSRTVFSTEWLQGMHR